MERVRDFGNRWWEYYPEGDGASDYWSLKYSVPEFRRSILMAAYIAKATDDYYYGFERTIEIQGNRFDYKQFHAPLETPLDELMTHIETMYEQYLKNMMDICTTLVKDFGISEKELDKDVQVFLRILQTAGIPYKVEFSEDHALFTFCGFQVMFGASGDVWPDIKDGCKTDEARFERILCFCSIPYTKAEIETAPPRILSGDTTDSHTPADKSWRKATMFLIGAENVTADEYDDFPAVTFDENGNVFVI